MKKIIWIVAISIPIISIFMLPTIIKADTLYNWTTQQARIQTTHDGTDTWTSWENISGDSSKVYEPTYPVKSLAYHLKTSRGMNKNYTYKFRFNYKPTPDSLHLESFYFENSTTGDRENVTCVQNMSSSMYYWFDCSFTPVVSYSSDDYLYVKLNFYSSYLTELRVGVRGYEELIGVNQVITEQTDNIITSQNQNTQEIINNINEANENLLNGLEEQNEVCNYYDMASIKKDNYYINASGNEQSNPEFGITDYLNIQKAKIHIIKSLSTSAAYCFYDTNKTIISCTAYTNNLDNTDLTIPQNAVYFRSSIRKSNNRPTFQICQNGNQAIQDTLNQDHDYNNTMTDQTLIDNMEQKEQEILEYLNLEPPDNLINITINPTIATYIWNIINRIRLSSTYITLLFTSILSLGVIKLVLNR